MYFLLPQSFFVKRFYAMQHGKKLNLKNPQTMNEKLSWYKLYYRDEKMRTCTDKASVRDYIREKGYGDLLNEVYGVYDKPEDIDWDKLPSQFVLKNTMGGYSLYVKLVFDKDSLNIEETNEMLRTWIKQSSNIRSLTGEWNYEKRKARILIEKLLIADEHGDLPDYKFMCNNGKVQFVLYFRNCTNKKSLFDGEVAMLDRDFNLLPCYTDKISRITEQPEKPKNYDEMIKIAEDLSADFPHVRVDLYNIDGRIVFGELTFFTHSGAIKVEPESYDYEWGKTFTLPKRNKYFF